MKLRDLVLAGILVTSGWCTQPRPKDEGALAAESRCKEVAALVRNQWLLVIGNIDGEIWVAKYGYMDGHLVPEIGNQPPKVVARLKEIMEIWDVCKTDAFGNGDSIQTKKFTWPEIAAAIVTMIWNNAE